MAETKGLRPPPTSTASRTENSSSALALRDEPDQLAVNEGELPPLEPVVSPERPPRLKQVSANAKEGLADFLSDWFGSLRLHHKEEHELQLVKRRDTSEAAVLGKASEGKAKQRWEKFQVVKDPLKGPRRIRVSASGCVVLDAGAIPETQEPPASRTQVADYRNATERQLKGMGWGGPPIKRPKRKDNNDVTPAQQMQLYLHGRTVPEDEHESLEEMIEERVYEEDTEFFVMQSFPTFTLIQSTLIFVSYILFSATSGKSFAGLETLFPGQTDLALTNVQTEGSSCEDFRFQLWRALTYQFTHSSFTHMLGNVLLLAICGISLEGFHGTLRLLWMFEIGVLGGAGCVCVFDSHARVVGMSGGAYSLLGQQLGDVLLNWERKSAPYRLIFIFLLTLTEVVLYLLNPQDEISYSAHMGGAVAGLLLVLVFGRNLTIKTYAIEQEVIRIAKALLFGLVIFCICWALLNWPPMDLIEQVPYCWSREVSNQTIFGDGTFHCVRCGDSDCIARWSPPLQNDSVPVNPRSCQSWSNP
eukprot:symbB.v1.2.027890.t1/scaffold2895.1/size67727/2